MPTTNNGKINDGPIETSALSRKKIDMSKVQCTSCFLLGHRSNMKACLNYKKNSTCKSGETAIQGIPQPTATLRKLSKKKCIQKKKGADVIIDVFLKRSMYVYLF